MATKVQKKKHTTQFELTFTGHITQFALVKALVIRGWGNIALLPRDLLTN